MRHGSPHCGRAAWSSNRALVASARGPKPGWCQKTAHVGTRDSGLLTIDGWLKFGWANCR
jgi:hypothetical protein